MLEKDLRAGGSIHTEKEDGYLIERGPNSTLDIYQEVDDLCNELGIISDKIFADSNTRNRYVVRGGRLRTLPTGLWQFLTTDLWSIRGKLRLLGEPFIPKYSGASEESIAGFVKRRTGQEFLDYAIDPFATGIFAGDPSRLSLKSCFPKMYSLEQEYGGLVKGAIFGRKKGGEPKRKMRLFSFKNGLQTLPDALIKILGNRFIGGWEVTSLKKDNTGFEISGKRGGHEEVLRADRVVLAAPAWVTANMIHPLSELIAANLMKIEYVPVVIVFTGFDRGHIKHNLDGFGFLIPSKESGQNGHSILGSIWSSAIFPGRAPDGKVAFTNILGGTRKTDILEYSDKELTDMTLRDLKTILNVEAKPEFLRIIRQPRAIPQYTLGHQGRADSIIKGAGEIQGLYLTGNYFNGVSVGHCIAEATRLAQKLIKN